MTHAVPPEGTAPDSHDDVLIHRDGPILRITLNRPRAINALTLEMAETILQTVQAVQAVKIAAAAADLAATDADDVPSSPDPARVILLDGAGERGFCGGGDIKQMAAGARSARAAGAVEFLRTEYRADFAIATSRVPVVGIMDGITMGGGIGLTGHASHRVVTERSRLAMPEARIGIAPDIGGHLLLARAPGRLGELLAITSRAFGAGDAIALGFADFYMPSDRLDELRAALAAGEDPTAAIEAVAIEAVPSELVAIDPVATDSAASDTTAEGVPEPEVLADRAWFDPLANAALGDDTAVEADPVSAAQRLIAALEASDIPAALETAAVVRAQCPTSVAVTLAGIARTRRHRLDLAAVLADDLRVLGRLLTRADFVEGVRARVIDKDDAPAWSPASIEELDRAEIAQILAPIGPDDTDDVILKL